MNKVNEKTMENELYRHIEVAKHYASHKFQAIAPIIPEIDPAWTLYVVYFYPNSTKIFNSYFLRRFSSEEELRIFCDMQNIELDESE